MGSSWAACDFKSPLDAAQIITEIKKRWGELEETPGVFRYKLDVKKDKFLPGECRYYVQLNTERNVLRRAPQSIASLRPNFDETKFNFNKIQPFEKMLEVRFRDFIVALIVNQSPLTKYHVLICPRVDANLPQVLTRDGIEFSVSFMKALGDPLFRIGYNSPGAWASVNHLHLHLIYLERELFVDFAELENIKDNIYRLAPKYPIRAICFTLNDLQSTKDEKILVDQVTSFVASLCDDNIPHNLFFTLAKSGEKGYILKVFVFARSVFCGLKEYNFTINVGFCELSGYIPVGDEKIYDSITETAVVDRISDETGDILRVLEDKVNQLRY